MRLLFLALFFPVSAFGQIIGYDPQTGAPLDPAVIGAPPIPQQTRPKSQKPAKQKPRPKKKQARRVAHGPAKERSRPLPKGQHHLHGERLPGRTAAPAAPVAPAVDHGALLERSAGEDRARRERIAALESKVRQVRAEIESSHRRNPHRTRSR